MSEMATVGRVAVGNSSGRKARRWWVLAVVCLAQLMITLDITIVNIALPAAQRDLGFSDAQRQWVITAYALAFGSLLLISGRIADRIGRRKALLIGLVVFGAGSALGGAAPNFALLVLARVAQGVGGSLMAPAALAAVSATFVDPKERARAFSIFGAIAAVGGALGLLLGGLLTEHLNWRWTLYVNLAIAAITLLGALVFIDRDVPAKRHPIDVLGTGLVTAGLFGVVFGFSRAETSGWSAPITWLTLVDQRSPARRLRLVADPRRQPPATAADPAGSRARRLTDRAHACQRRPVRGVPVPDLLPADLAGLHAGQDRARLPSPHRGHDGGVPGRPQRSDALHRAAAHRPGRHAHRRSKPGLADPTRVELGVLVRHRRPLVLLGLGLGMVIPLAISLSTARLDERTTASPAPPSTPPSRSADQSGSPCSAPSLPAPPPATSRRATPPIPR